MLRRELIDRLALELRTSTRQATLLLDTTLQVITQGLREDREVTIPGFGTFVAKPTPARIGFNPQTGERMTIRAHMRVTLRSSAKLKQALDPQSKVA